MFELYKVCCFLTFSYLPSSPSFSFSKPICFLCLHVLFDPSLNCSFFPLFSWPIPQLEPSQIRLIVYQDCERRGRNVLFDSNAKKRGTEETPITVSHMLVFMCISCQGKNCPGCVGISGVMQHNGFKSLELIPSIVNTIWKCITQHGLGKARSERWTQACTKPWPTDVL